MYVSLRLIKNEAKILGRSTRNISRYVGKSMLRNILNDIDILSMEDRNLSDAVGAISNTYLNPSYIYKKYANIFDSGISEDSAGSMERFIKGGIYNHQRVFSQVQYYSSVLRNSKQSNKLLRHIFHWAIVSNVAFEASEKIYVYKMVSGKNKETIIRMATDEYKKREKYITGLTIKDIYTKLKTVFDGDHDVIYVEMGSRYVPPYRKIGYYNRMMDTGTYMKKDIPDLEAIYGWIKRRKASGLWRPLILVDWQNRGRSGKLSGKPQTRPAKDYEAAFVIANRMERLFKKRGRLYPFGNFSKHTKRNTVYDVSIFNAIFRRYVMALERTVKRDAKSVQNQTESILAAKISDTIKHISRGNKSAERSLKSLNYMIKINRISEINRGVDIISIPSKFKLTDLKKLIALANKLNIVIQK